ncbi:MAG: hypothetical protein QXU64_01580 [Thermofilaceae archaeon]
MKVVVKKEGLWIVSIQGYGTQLAQDVIIDGECPYDDRIVVVDAVKVEITPSTVYIFTVATYLQEIAAAASSGR